MLRYRHPEPNHPHPAVLRRGDTGVPGDLPAPVRCNGITGHGVRSLWGRGAGHLQHEEDPAHQLGAAFHWKVEDFGPNFSSTPKEGYISPGMQVKFQEAQTSPSIEGIGPVLGQE